MPQQFQVLRCYSCDTFQVHQVKKSNKFNCKLCGEKQTIKKVYGEGTGADCRKHVQKLNTLRGELDEQKQSMTFVHVERQDLDVTSDAEVHTQSADQLTPSGEIAGSQGSRWGQYLEENTGQDPEEEADHSVDMYTTDSTQFSQLHKTTRRQNRSRYRDQYSNRTNSDHYDNKYHGRLMQRNTSETNVFSGQYGNVQQYDEDMETKYQKTSTTTYSSGYAEAQKTQSKSETKRFIYKRNSLAQNSSLGNIRENDIMISQNVGQSSKWDTFVQKPKDYDDPQDDRNDEAQNNFGMQDMALAKKQTAVQTTSIFNVPHASKRNVEKNAGAEASKFRGASRWSKFVEETEEQSEEEEEEDENLNELQFHNNANFISNEVSAGDYFDTEGGNIEDTDIQDSDAQIVNRGMHMPQRKRQHRDDVEFDHGKQMKVDTGRSLINVEGSISQGGKGPTFDVGIELDDVLGDDW